MIRRGDKSSVVEVEGIRKHYILSWCFYGRGLVPLKVRQHGIEYIDQAAKNLHERREKGRW